MADMYGKWLKWSESDNQVPRSEINSRLIKIFFEQYEQWEILTENSSFCVNSAKSSHWANHANSSFFEIVELVEQCRCEHCSVYPDSIQAKKNMFGKLPFEIDLSGDTQNPKFDRITKTRRGNLFQIIWQKIS